MKKLFFLLVINIVGNHFTFAQTNTFPPNGDVGIGISPDSKLSVLGDFHGYGMMGGNGGYFNVLKIPALDSSPLFFYIDTNIPATDQAAPQIQITGYMYSQPNKAMKITLSWYYYSGNFYWSQYQSDLGYYKPSRVRLGKYSKNGTEYVRIELSNNATYWSNYTITATDRADFPSFYKGWTYFEGEMPTNTTFQITRVEPQSDVLIDGNVGIGTSRVSGYKLAVAGNIIAESMKVTPQTAWPDYVFNKDFKILPLEDLKSFIDINKHLPDLPPAIEIEKSGIDLGKITTSLLKKIEELTLYVIELKNENKELKEATDKQRQINVLTKNELSELRNILHSTGNNNVINSPIQLQK